MKKTITRIAACSLAVLIAFNTVAIPKSKAVVGTSALAGSVLATYMTSTGVTLGVVQGGAAAASAGTASMISGYAAATGTTSAAVSSGIAAGVTIGTGGAIIIGVAAAALLAGIVAWAISEYGLSAGGTSVSIYQFDGFLHADGTPVLIYDGSDVTWDYMESLKSGYACTEPNLIPLSNGKQIGCAVCADYPDNYYVGVFNADGTRAMALGASQTSFVSKDYSYFNIYYVSPYVYFLLYDSDGNYIKYWTSLLASGVTGDIETDLEPYFGSSVSDDLQVSLPADYEAPPKVEEQYSMVIDTGMTFADEQEFIDAVLGGVAAGTLAPTYSIEPSTTQDVIVPGEITETQFGILSWVKTIAQRVAALPQAIAEAVKGIFVPDAALTTEITDTFSQKFGFMSELHALGADLLNVGVDTEPPVVYIHLEDAEGTIDYGGTVKALDMSWYERYKPDGDRIIGGFLWLGFLWLLFKRASAIINGAEMQERYSIDIENGHRGGGRKS